MDSVRTTLFGDKGYKCMVLFSKEVSDMEEITHKSQDIFTNRRLVFLIEKSYEFIGARGFSKA